MTVTLKRIKPESGATTGGSVTQTAGRPPPAMGIEDLRVAPNWTPGGTFWDYGQRPPQRDGHLQCAHPLEAMRDHFSRRIQDEA